jgi:hypothetical protein
VNSGAPITADATLLDAYREWRRLAELEGEAIRARDWSLVADYQNQLSALQARIARLTRQAREELQRAGFERAGKENHLRGIISGLIELESQNNASLAAAKEAARKQLDQLDSARQNLKRVQRSYSPRRAAMWNSFS